MRNLTFIALLGWSLIGCGPSSGTGGKHDLGPGGDGGTGGPIPGLMSIDIAPPMVALTVSNMTAATADFTATGHFMDGHTADITAALSWSLADGGIGSMDHGHFTSVTNRGGKTVVEATDGVQTGMAQLTLKYQATRLSTDDGSTAPASSASLFAGMTGEPTLAPTLVYPLDGALVPRNLGELEVQWKRPTQPADLYEVSFESDTLDLKVYTNATQPAQGGRLSLLQSEWDALSASIAGSTVSIAVRALATSDPTKIGGSQPAALEVGTDDVMGGIYYWSASGLPGSTEGIKRHAFGDVTGMATDFYTQNDGNAVFNDGLTTHCVACHVLSRDGTKFAITYNGGDGVSALLDVATKTATIPASKGLYWNFATMSPDGMKMIASHQGVLTLYDISGGPTTGNVLGTVDTGGYATHPDWSPDGKSLVFVRVAAPGSDWTFRQGAIVELTDSGMGFANPQVLVPSQVGSNNYYPSFSPDSKWILFNRSQDSASDPNDGDSYNDPSAEVWTISADGTVGPTELLAADATGNLTNSWARWSPFVQHNAENRDVYYFTFSSQRDYGIELGSLNPQNPNRPQVWMAAFDPTVASSKADPSTVPFWLPFQDVTTNNHIAQWTQQIVGIQ
ncbi:MAG TPA: hypothetical protein VII38_08720 [Polyangia bacterium]